MAERKAPRAKRKLDPESEAWNKLPWHKLEQHVNRIQKRIYRADQRGKTRTVHKLQKLLMKSEAARLLAVRRVTQDNQGKKTAGVDGVKSVEPQARLLLAERLHPKNWKKSKTRAVRRVWIPKPGKPEKRPLGIPTMFNRAQQALVKLAMEPAWESRFEPNSYGFRPGRGCHDAIEAIRMAIRYKPKFVYDADITGCFDHIDHQALLNKLHTYPFLSKVIRSWLKAGVLEGADYTPTEAGTPQGGVISPLLANIALHGMEEAVTQGYTPRMERPLLVRYADDFVLFHSNLSELEQAAKRVTEWLKGIGLTLNPKKTQITHTLTPYEGKVGFDFLGFTVRQFPAGKTHTGKNPHGKPLGFQTIIRPSKESIKRHSREMKKRIRELRSVAQQRLIQVLNPIIRGWTAYYRTVVSSRVFHRCDKVMWYQLLRWTQARHRHKGSRWIDQRYWQRKGNRRMVFRTPDNVELRLHSQTLIQRHTKVKGRASPYDGNILYWSQRLRAHPMLTGTKAKVLQKQHGKCRWCELMFKDGDLLETDHIDRNHHNNALSNLIVLHRHCHDERHARWNDQQEIQHRAEAGINLK